MQLKKILNLILLSLVCLGGCSGDYSKKLPNGYVLLRTNTHTTIIIVPDTAWGKVKAVDQNGNVTFKGKSIAVGPSIERIGFSGDYIFGFVKSSLESEVSQLSVPGYFILDSSNHVLLEGLGRSEWESKIQAMNITSYQLYPRSHY